ncbi:MAG: HAMP domain-containing protein, partial [Halobacteriota archaeon]
MLNKIRLSNTDLRPKIILAFVLVAALVAVTGAVGYTSVVAVDEEAHLIAEDGQKMDASAEMIVGIEQQRAAIQAARLGDENAQQEFEEANQLFNEQAQHLEETELSPEQEEQFETLESQHEEYNALGSEFFEAQQEGDSELATEKAEEMESLRAPMEENAHSIEESAQADLESQVAIADSTTQTAQMEIIGLTIGAFVVAVVIGLFVAKRITAPVSQLSEAAVAASDGDFDTDIDDHVENDELGRMVDSFREMQANLKSVFGEIDTFSNNLATGDEDLRTR